MARKTIQDIERFLTPAGERQVTTAVREAAVAI